MCKFREHSQQNLLPQLKQTEPSLMGFERGGVSGDIVRKRNTFGEGAACGLPQVLVKLQIACRYIPVTQARNYPARRREEHLCQPILAVIDDGCGDSGTLALEKTAQYFDLLLDLRCRLSTAE